MWSAYRGWLSMPLEAVMKYGVASLEDWPMLKFQLLQGRIECATRGSACFDLFATEEVTFEPGQTIAIPTGVFTEFDRGLRAIIKERSGLALKKELHVHGGVIDSDYRDEWKVIAQWNPWHVWDDQNEVVSYTIKPGDKIAQFKLEEIPIVDYVGSGIVFNDQVRAGGFGSTDKCAQCENPLLKGLHTCGKKS